jgi:hypothetical protein
MGMKRQRYIFISHPRFLRASLVDVFALGCRRRAAKLGFLDSDSLIATFVLVESVTSP